MLIELRLTDDELAQLYLVLSQDVESSRDELHQTEELPYREYTKRRLEQGEALLVKLESSLPSAANGFRQLNAQAIPRSDNGHFSQAALPD